MSSILRQTYDNFEILLIDDGSPDYCGTLCDYYAESDSRVRVIHQTNRGVSFSRNVGICEASGSYLLFVDADDWLEPDCLECIVGVSSSKKMDIVYFGYYTEPANGKSVAEKPPAMRLSELDMRELQICLIKGTKFRGFYPWAPWGRLIRRDILLQNHIFFPENLICYEDNLFNLLLLEKKPSGYMLPYAGYHYRINAHSLTHQFSPRAANDLAEAAAEMRSFLNHYHRNDAEYLDAFGHRAMHLFAQLEKVCTFHKNAPYSRREIVQITRRFLRISAVMYAFQCISTAKRLSTVSHIRYALFVHNHWNLYWLLFRVIHRCFA